MTKAEREARAVAGHRCPEYRCFAEKGEPCGYWRGIFDHYRTRTFKHPHAKRLALVPDVTITRVYLVDCSLCGAVNLDLGSCETPGQAKRMRDRHLEEHHAPEEPEPDPVSQFQAGEAR